MGRADKNTSPDVFLWRNPSTTPRWNMMGFGKTREERVFPLPILRPLELQNIKPDPAIDQIDQSPVVERHIVALRRLAARGRLRDEISNLPRRQRIADVDDPQSAREPDRMDDRSAHPFGILVRAETCAADAAEGCIKFAD